MKRQAVRILIACVGIAATTAMYPSYAFLYQISHPNAALWFCGFMTIAFLVGLLTELVPFTVKLSPSWGAAAVTLAAGIALFLLHSPVVIAVAGGWSPAVEALVSSRWMAPMGAVIFGTLLGKALKGNTA